MTVEEILAYKLKKLIGPAKFSNCIKPEDTEFALKQAKVKIQSYCHRMDIPKPLYYIWADIAIAELNDIMPKLFVKEVDEDELVNNVTSIKTGDTTISLDNGGSESSKGSIELLTESDKVLMSVASQLQAYRKFPSGCGCGLNGS